MTAARPDAARGFGVYFHWPFCSRLCPYCDFNVFVTRPGEVDPLIEALEADLAAWRRRSGARPVRSVYFGGGTPSLLPPAAVERLIGAVDRLWGFEASPEVTLEANPDERARFADLARAGVNRLSIGVQSLDDRRLAFLGRTHSAGDAKAAVEAAAGRFASVSADLIYADPGASPDGWRSELRAALALGVDHLSLYELSIEPGAPFARHVAEQRWRPLDDDLAADLYDLTQADCASAGLPAYEISNHARSPAHRSAHNTIYWRSGDWVGAGPGAHGRLTTPEGRLATETPDRPRDYIAAVSRGDWGASQVERLTPVAEARERIAMGLRLVEGMPEADPGEVGAAWDAAGLREALAAGLLVRAGDRLRLTDRGRLVADRVAALIAP